MSVSRAPSQPIPTATTSQSSQNIGQRCMILESPPEVHLCILEFVTVPSDLISVLRTHAPELQIVSMQLLYKKITLRVDQLDRRLETSLNSSNRGLRYVKALRLTHAYNYVEEKHGMYLGRLLLSLPRDRLKKIYIASSQGMSPGILAIILSTQRKLENFASQVSGLLPDLQFAPPPGILRNITYLYLQFETKHDVASWAPIFPHLTQLKELMLSVVGRRAVSTMDVMQALFDPPRSGAEIKLDLERLDLRYFDFMGGTTHFFNFLNSLVDSLKHLTLGHCRDSWIVQHVLKDKPMKLKSFIDTDYTNDGPRPLPRASFSESIRTLTRFSSIFTPTNLDDWEYSKGIGWHALQKQASTLQILEIDDVADEPDGWTVDTHRSMADFRDLCSQLVKLKQLAIRPPTIHMGSRSLIAGFNEFLDCLKQLKSLTSLKLWVRTESKDYKPLDKEPAASVVLEMQKLADVVFTTLHASCPRFMALELCVDGSIDSVELTDRHHETRFGYLCSTRVDHYRRETVIGNPIEVDKIWHHEPNDEIFRIRDDWYGEGWGEKKKK